MRGRYRAVAKLGMGVGRQLAASNSRFTERSTTSIVDLNPQISVYYAMASGKQPSGPRLWKRNRRTVPRPPVERFSGSVVDLHPSSGFAASRPTASYGNNIVGQASRVGQFQALLWQGPAHTVVILHSAAYPQTMANDDSQDSQVGTGIFSSTPGGERHALLWHDTAASVIDLHPTGFTQTDAYGAAGTQQVGYGQGTATGGNEHALLWEGSAASVIDLHSMLTGLGHTFVSSEAFDIDATGVIVGEAVDNNNNLYAVEWTPVPEPATVILLIFGLSGFALPIRIRRLVETRSTFPGRTDSTTVDM